MGLRFIKATLFAIARDQTLQNLTTITLNNLKSKPRLGAKIHTHYNICTYTHVDINKKIS